MRQPGSPAGAEVARVGVVDQLATSPVAGTTLGCRLHTEAEQFLPRLRRNHEEFEAAAEALPISHFGFERALVLIAGQLEDQGCDRALGHLARHGYAHAAYGKLDRATVDYGLTLILHDDGLDSHIERHALPAPVFGLFDRGR